jgi:hypothetical protein
VIVFFLFPKHKEETALIEGYHRMDSEAAAISA